MNRERLGTAGHRAQKCRPSTMTVGAGQVKVCVASQGLLISVRSLVGWLRSQHAVEFVHK